MIGRFGWRWIAALVLFACGFGGLVSGVSLSERPAVVEADALTRAYYSLGLFVVGGLDLGTPVGGPMMGRVLLWVAYFGAPLLTASAVIDALLRVMAPDRWYLARLKDHVIIAGSGDLTTLFLRELRRRDRRVRVVVVDDEPERNRGNELERTFDVKVIAGDITHEYFLNELRPGRARRVLLLSAVSFDAFEAADLLLRRYPALADRIIVHCHRLRFLRAVQDTNVARQSVTFNAYNLAATGLVRDQLIAHFHKTAGRDAVVIAGFGRFGQSILEELQQHAHSQVGQLVLVDIDARRRVQVVKEQERISFDEPPLVLEGDISNPQVWQQVVDVADFSRDEPTVILGTGRSEENLRTALWIKRKYPNAFVFARTNDESEFARHVTAEHGIHSISIAELVRANIPEAWF